MKLVGLRKNNYYPNPFWDMALTLGNRNAADCCLACCAQSGLKNYFDPVWNSVRFFEAHAQFCNEQDFE